MVMRGMRVEMIMINKMIDYSADKLAMFLTAVEIR